MTLVELVVVISIIGALVALTVPALRSAMRSARQTICLTHARHLHTAVIIHAAEHDQRLVADRDLSRGDGVLDARSRNSWADLLYWDGHLPLDAAACPSDDSPLARPDRSRRSYAINAYLYAWNPPGWPSGRTPHVERDIPRPADSILLADGAARGDRITGLWPEVAEGLLRHRHAATYAYFDGHASTITFAEMFGIEPTGHRDPDQVDAMFKQATGHPGPWQGAGPVYAEYFTPWAPWPDSAGP